MLKCRHLTLVTTLLGVLSLAPVAQAGEGAAAGAAAFSIDAGGNVTGVAVAAAVGKQDAFAGALNDPAGLNANTAFALGSAGVITVGGIDQFVGFTNVQGSSDPALEVDQANSFGADAATISIGTVGGDPLVNLGNP